MGGQQVSQQETHHVEGLDFVAPVSSAMSGVVELALRVAPLPCNVLIVGETGTGKEILARLLHLNSGRPANAMVAVNVAAVPPALFSSEFFGHERGAFTGAVERRIGRLEAAHGGTLFLDEVGDLSRDGQAAFLRVLQERRFERVGGTETLASDFRLVAATHRNLAEMVRCRTFREDLYFRIKVVELRVPPLREHPEDIPALVRFFVRKHARRYGRTPPHIGEGAFGPFFAYDWPGNVRELENVVEHTIATTQSDILDATTWRGLPATSEARSLRSLPAVVADFERRMLLGALCDAGGIKSRASRLLGIPLQTLQHKCKKYGL